MNKDIKAAIKDFQRSDLYEEFKKNYPESLKNYERDLANTIEELVRKELDE